MKKIILSSVLLLFTIAGFGQELKPVQIDSLVTVSLPETYNKKDTLGQQVISANGSFGYMVVIKAESAKNNEPLKKENDLNKVMKNYVKGLQGQYRNSSAQNVRDTTVGALKATAFTLKSDDAGNGDIQLKNFIVLYTNAATYTFEYGYQDARSEVIKDELKKFTGSIAISPELKRTDQYLSNAPGMSSAVKFGLFGGGGLLVIAVIVIMLRRKKEEEELVYVVNTPKPTTRKKKS
jgi:hypothetical protein